MNHRIDVYGIGHALVDLQFSVTADTLAALGIAKGVMTLIDEQRLTEIVSALDGDSVKSASGGSAANTMIASARFGSSAFYACQVGDDEWGGFYRDDLERAGVGTSPDIVGKGRTGQCVVFVTPDADRTLNTFLGASSVMGPVRVSEEIIEDSGFIYLEGYLLTSDDGLAACLKAQETAARVGTAVSLTLSDPAIVGAFRERFENLIGKGIDLLFCNEEEAQAYTNEGSTDAAVDALAEVAPALCVTCGPRGAITCEKGVRFEIPGVTVQAIDTTGAGDSFAGGVLAGLSRDRSLPEAAVLGCYAASQVVSAYGPRLVSDLSREIDHIIDAAPSAMRMTST